MGLSPKLVWRVHGELPGGPPDFLLFFIVCTEVNEYPAMEYFPETDDSFMNFRKSWLRR